MLYYLFQWIDKAFHFPGSRLMGYISFVQAWPLFFSMITSPWFFGGSIIRTLKRLQVGETIRDLGQRKGKGRHITMGRHDHRCWDYHSHFIIGRGWIMCISRLCLFSTCWMGAIGFADDYIKVFLKTNRTQSHIQSGRAGHNGTCGRFCHALPWTGSNQTSKEEAPLNHLK